MAGDGGRERMSGRSHGGPPGCPSVSDCCRWSSTERVRLVGEGGLSECGGGMKGRSHLARRRSRPSCDPEEGMSRAPPGPLPSGRATEVRRDRRPERVRPSSVRRSVIIGRTKSVSGRRWTRLPVLDEGAEEADRGEGGSARERSELSISTFARPSPLRAARTVQGQIQGHCSRYAGSSKCQAIGRPGGDDWPSPGSTEADRRTHEWTCTHPVSLTRDTVPSWIVGCVCGLIPVWRIPVGSPSLVLDDTPPGRVLARTSLVRRVLEDGLSSLTVLLLLLLLLLVWFVVDELSRDGSGCRDGRRTRGNVVLLLLAIKQTHRDRKKGVARPKRTRGAIRWRED